MEQNEQSLSHEESMSLIEQMILTAKNEQRDNGKGWIIWGWLIFLASVFTYLNLKFNWVSTYFFWNLFGMATLILMGYETFQFLFGKKKERVRTYTKDLMDKLNIGFFISLMLIIFSMNLGVPPVKGFGLLLGLYGFWILIYGSALNFRPSIIGAYLTWAFAFATLFVNDFQWTMLLHAGAVLCGYIIPGHIANVEFNKLNKAVSKTRV
ncbi:MAG: hypothetical protein ICV79_01645 [Flavisolibacter sp.]|nr:hypothetical protein [Flavisolibacter sp.]